LDRKIDNVATEKSLQEGGARRFPLWESGGGPPHYDGDEARQEIVGRADRVHSDRQVREGSDSVDPLEVVNKAIENVRPRLEVKSRRVGGATYQVPMEVTPARQISLATRWIVQYADNRKGMPMAEALAQEIKDAAAGQGNAIKKREDTHKMAQANRAFAHFRW
jgi:ribosomal protein S7